MALSLIIIIKGLDNQAQELNYQINQYPKKSLIVILDSQITQAGSILNQ
jgi:hypothetical protein